MQVCSSCNEEICSCNKIYKSKTKEYRKEYYLKNKDKINEQRRKKYYSDPLKYKEQSKKSHALNREKRIKKQKEYYIDNVEYFKDKNKRYRDSNKDYILLKNQKRKNLLKSKNIPQSEIESLLNLNDYKCFYCKIIVKRGINLHLDHKIPLSRGGSHSIDNLVPSCKTCNLQKGTKTDEEFIKHINQEMDNSCLLN